MPSSSASPLHYGWGQKPEYRPGTGLGGCYSTASRNRKEKRSSIQAGFCSEPALGRGRRVEQQWVGGAQVLPGHHHSTGSQPLWPEGRMGFRLPSLLRLRSSVLGKDWALNHLR